MTRPGGLEAASAASNRQRAASLTRDGSFELDAPLPDIPESNASKSGRERVIARARRDNLTVRQLAHMKSMSETPWITTLGIGKRLRRLGVNAALIRVLDWTENTRIGPVELTALEFDLLWFLATHPRSVFSRAQLLAAVWGHTGALELGTSTVTVHVRRLREKIEANPSQPVVVQTVWGVGYRFVP